MQYNTVSIAATATQIFTGNRARGGFMIQGEKILADGSATWNGQLWGIVTASTADLRFFEWGENDVN